MNADVRLLIQNKKKQILLVKDKKKIIIKPDGKTFQKPEGWGMPGGRSEPEDKTELDTAEREVLHEIGVLPEIDERMRIEKRKDDHIKVVFAAWLAPGTAIKTDPEEILECRWFPRSVLQDEKFNMYAIQRRMAQELLRKLGC